MKNFVVYYRFRGSNYSLAPLREITVRAMDKKEAKIEAFMRVGDDFKIVKVKEM